MHRKKYVETTWIFVPTKLRQKRSWKQREFFHQRNYIEKNKWKKRGSFDQRNYTEKIKRKQRGFFHQRNYVKKKCVEMTWIFRSAKLVYAIKIFNCNTACRFISKQTVIHTNLSIKV